MSASVVGLSQGVAVPFAPSWVNEPDLTWAEAAVMILFVASVGYYTFVLARAWWPWSRRRQATKREARWWVASFIAWPVLFVALFFVSKAEDQRFERLRAERNEAVATLTDQAPSELTSEYGVISVDGSTSRVDFLVDYPKNLHGTMEAMFANSAGVEVECTLEMTPTDGGRELTLDCPSTDASEEP